MDRSMEWQGLVRSLRPAGSSRPVTNILPKKADKGGASVTAHALMSGIKRTHATLRAQESAYTALRGGLTDLERDELDATVRDFMADCGERIDELKKRMVAEGGRPVNVDELAHLKGLVLVLLESLDDLSQYFQRFKAFRVKQALRERSAFDEMHRAGGDWQEPSGVPEDGGGAGGGEDLGLSPEEMAMFERENQELQQELDSKIEQLRAAEREMSMVTSMCELTSTKILEQAQEIDALYDTVVKAVEDIDLGNVQLQKAAEATVSSRVFMLVFLFVASLTLLFLHWYLD